MKSHQTGGGGTTRPFEHIVKIAGLSDLEDILRIVQVSFESPWDEQMLRGTIISASYDVRVLRLADGRTIGLYIAHAVNSEWNLDIVAVDTPERGKGWGTLLLHNWIGSARRRRVRLLALQVNAKNTRAIALYDSLGLKKTGLIDDYYPNGDSAWEMKCRLPDF